MVRQRLEERTLYGQEFSLSAADGAITPIQPGEVDVKASVTMTYAIS